MKSICLEKQEITNGAFPKSYAKAKNSYFFHYTKIDSYRKINKEKFFMLSCPYIRCNDKDESKRKIHMICFCRTRTEKLPFWLNYATTDRGVALRLTYNMLNRFIKCFDALYGEDKKIKYLRSNNDYKVYCGSCIYKNDGDFDNNFLLKKKAWSYESEFRIYVLLNEFKENERLYIKLNDSILKDIYLMFSYGANEEDYKDLIEMKKYSKSRVNASFDLVETYKENIPDFISRFDTSNTKNKELLSKITNEIKKKKC